MLVALGVNLSLFFFLSTFLTCMPVSSRRARCWGCRRTPAWRRRRPGTPPPPPPTTTTGKGGCGPRRPPRGTRPGAARRRRRTGPGWRWPGTSGGRGRHLWKGGNSFLFLPDQHTHAARRTRHVATTHCIHGRCPRLCPNQMVCFQSSRPFSSSTSAMISDLVLIQILDVSKKKKSSLCINLQQHTNKKKSHRPPRWGSPRSPPPPPRPVPRPRQRRPCRRRRRRPPRAASTSSPTWAWLTFLLYVAGRKGNKNERLCCNAATNPEKKEGGGCKFWAGSFSNNLISTKMTWRKRCVHNLYLIFEVPKKLRCYENKIFFWKFSMLWKEYRCSVCFCKCNEKVLELATQPPFFSHWHIFQT